jgi:hypothetical protein
MVDTNSKEYIINCWQCTAPFNAYDAPFCNHGDPTKVCPFCLQCSCDAPEAYKKSILQGSPKKILEEKMDKVEGKDLKLGEVLVKNEKISRAQLHFAMEEQKRSGIPLGEIIVSMGFLTHHQLKLFLMEQKNMDSFNLEGFKIDFSLLKKVGIAFCLKYQVIPIEYLQTGKEKILRFVVGSRDALNCLKGMTQLHGLVLIPYLADQQKILALLQEVANGELMVVK